MPGPAGRETGYEHGAWGNIVPYGSRFSHWGGRHISRVLGRLISQIADGPILDVCCGEAGTADYIDPWHRVIGLDISPTAIAWPALLQAAQTFASRR